MQHGRRTAPRSGARAEMNRAGSAALPRAWIHPVAVPRNMTRPIPRQRRSGPQTLVMKRVANEDKILLSDRRRILQEGEAFNQLVSRTTILTRITIPLTLRDLKLLGRTTRRVTSKR